MNTNKIQPIFFCCYRPEELHEYTFNSYNSYVYDHFLAPIIFFNSSDDDNKNKIFKAKIKELFGTRRYHIYDNRIIHDYQSVQVASCDCLLYANNFVKKRSAWWNYFLLRKPMQFDGVLFCEDDISFSNLFVDRLQAFSLPEDASFLTMYQPENGYVRSAAGAFAPGNFYGTQSLYFPLDSLRELCYDAEVLKKNMDGYDKVWAHWLAAKGHKPYCLDASYVQHNQVASLLAGHTRTHTSSIYKFNWEGI